MKKLTIVLVFFLLSAGSVLAYEYCAPTPSTTPIEPSITPTVTATPSATLTPTETPCTGECGGYSPKPENPNDGRSDGGRSSDFEMKQMYSAYDGSPVLAK